MEELEKLFYFYNPDEELKKVVVGGLLDEKHKHLTLRIWNKERKVDLHINDESLPKGHPDKYFTIFEITFDKLKELVKEMEKFDLSIFKHFFEETITVGRLRRSNSYLQTISDDLNNAKRYFKLKSNGRRGKFKRDLKFHDVEDLLFWPEDVIDHEKGAFLAYRIKKGKHLLNGYVYRFPIHAGTSKFIFVSKRKMNKFQSQVMQFACTAIEKVDFKNKEYVVMELRNMLSRRFSQIQLPE